MPKKPLIDKEGEVREITAADMKPFRPLKDADPHLYGLFKKSRGRPKSPNPKREIKVRIDADILAWLKAEGRGYQTRLNAILRMAMER